MKRLTTLTMLCGFGFLLFIGHSFVSCGDVLDPGSEVSPKETQGADASATDSSPKETVAVKDNAPFVNKHVPYEKTWYGGSVMYQIFPRSFYDSNGDGVGDLKGIQAKLDYLNTGKSESTDDLKVAGVWLTPIFKSGSYHGYDVEDYKALDPNYGSMADFQAFLDAAHKRGIKVILDLVINHSSRNHPWFKDASSSEQASKRDWYVWSNEKLDWEHPFSPGQSPWRALGAWYFYGVFSTSMPDMNLKNTKVRDAFKDVIKFWLEKGVDGFRLDAIRYLIAEGKDKQKDSQSTHEVLKEFVKYAQPVNKDVLFVGEAWTTTEEVARYFGQGDEMDLCFHFELVDAVERAFQRGRASTIFQAMGHVLSHYKELNFNSPILSNHDLKRLHPRLGKSWEASKAASTLLLTLPGTPFVYYGDEIGLGNSAESGDKSKRSPMQWDTSKQAGFSKGLPWGRLSGSQDSTSVEVQSKDPNSLLSHYRNLIRLRNASSTLRFGDMTLLESSDPAVFAFLRSYKGERVIVFLNVSESKVASTELKWNASWGDVPTGDVDDKVSGQKVKLSKSGDAALKLTDIAAYQSSVLILP